MRFGSKTARAISRYLRARAKHKGADLADLWLADRGVRRLAPNGIKIMLSAVGWLRVCLGCTRIGGGTSSPTSGNGPAGTPAI